MLLPTPYYRTLTTINTVGYDEEADFNYTPYDIFCMETRLCPIVYKLLGRDTEINFISIHENNRMNLKIKLISSNVPDNINKNILNDINDVINYIVTYDKNYCFIDANELYIAGRGDYPKTWYNQILRYITLPEEYNPYFKDNGIYLSFNPFSDYKKAYNEIVKLILDTLQTYYRDGVVYGASNIHLNWKLEVIDYNEIKPKLYKATWKDKRFAPNLVEFLREKINGDPYIKIKVSDNLVVRHFIASYLIKDNFVFIIGGNHIKIEINNLDDAQYVASLITYSESLAKGKVATYASNEMTVINSYIKKSDKLLGGSYCISYQTTDIEKPFMFSCLIDKNMSETSVLSEINKQNIDNNVKINKNNMDDIIIANLKEINKINKLDNKLDNIKLDKINIGMVI